MSRLEVELTSQRSDGSWTWRAAGAKQPKGELDGSLVPAGTSVGDVVRVEAEVAMDGMVITSVRPPQKARREPERMQMLGSQRHEPGVTTNHVSKGDRRARDGQRGGGRRNEGARRDREARGERGGSAPKVARDRRDRQDGGSSRDLGRQHERSSDLWPRPKRLRAGRKHRNAALSVLPAEQRPLAKEVLKGGVPGVRQTIERLNETAASESRPPIDTERLVGLAERLLPHLRGAEWRDRAEAAIAQVDEVDLGDLRSVVNAADTWARGDEARSMARQLREVLPARVEKQHQDWLREISDNLADGRVVRALRLSSRPPKAGAPLPGEIAESLATRASSSLVAETGSDRYAAVIEALALSPVHAQVIPQGRPNKPTNSLIAMVKRTAKDLPQVAEMFGVEPEPSPPRGSRPSRRPRPKSAQAPAPSAAGSGSPEQATDTH